MKDWEVGDVSGSETLADTGGTDNLGDHLYPSHINELRTAMPIPQASFVVFVDGSNYKAIDNTGALVSTNIDATVVTKYCIDNMPSAGGLIFFRAGTYNFATTTPNPSNAAVFSAILLGSTGGTKNNIHIKGEGLDATILKYTGAWVVGNYRFLEGWYVSGTAGAGEGAQTGISVSNLTIDCNGSLLYGIVFQYMHKWFIENVKVKNHNIFEVGSVKAGIAIYSGYGVLNNIWIDPPMVTANTVTGEPEYLDTSLLFDSTYCHDVFANNIFLDGNDLSISQSAISFEDNPYNVWIQNVSIKRFTQNAIVSAANDTALKSYHFKDIYITDCGGAINLPDKTDYVTLKNIYISEIKSTTLTNVVSIKGDHIDIDGLYLVNAPNVTGSWVSSLYLEGTDNLRASKVFISGSKASGIYFADGNTDTLLESSRIAGCTGYGIYLNNPGGGTKPTDVRIKNSTIKNNDQGATGKSGIIDAGIRTVITGCDIIDDQATKTQDYGIDSQATGSKYTNNYFAGNVTKQITIGSGTPIIRNNVGFITENSGTGTIASGATSAVITHGLAVTPTLDDISITLGELSTADPGQIYVDTITATQFTVKCRTDPGASNLDFAWQAICL